MLGDQILFVDDDANILAAYQRSLRKRFNVVTSLSGEHGLELLARDGPFAVIVADMQMPGMNGIQFLRKVQEQSPDSVRLMLTGNADQKTAVDAVNQGHVFSFLTKPHPMESLEAAVANAVKQYRLIIAEKVLLEQTLNGAIKVLTDILSMNDPRAFGKALRLREEVKVIAAWFRAARPWELELGAMLSQIGYVAIPGKVLEKLHTGMELGGAEKDMITRVPETGATFLENIPRLETVTEIVRYQNKNFDGSGFPIDNTAGESIPIGARILRVLVELLDAEGRKESRETAFQKMRRSTGLYDPKVLEAIAVCHDVYLDAPETVNFPTVPIPFFDLAPGNVLGEDVRTADGLLLVTAGTNVSMAILQKLRNFAELNGIIEPILVRK